MTPKKMASSLLNSVVHENCIIYRDLFNNTKITNVSDVYWQNAISLYESLDNNQKEVFFSIIRQTAIDTVSNVLGVIDGSTYLEEMDGELNLLSGTGVKLNGDLQGFFLEQEEIESYGHRRVNP